MHHIGKVVFVASDTPCAVCLSFVSQLGRVARKTRKCGGPEGKCGLVRNDCTYVSTNAVDGVRLYIRPTMYIPVATSHLFAVCIPSHPKPIANANIESTIRILGRDLPKSAMVSVVISLAAATAVRTSVASNNQEYYDLQSETDSIR